MFVFLLFCLSVPIDVLLVAYDTGDSNIIRQLAEKMEKRANLIVLLDLVVQNYI
ncbi:MAG: hypothetical protein H6925_07040 [Holosporaceae bacterium]|nr:MAG: hypothetical protein H6925_07040 [Holosporaceae bacterium]